MNITTVGLLLAGLALLIAGAEALVRGASKLAAAFGIPPLVIGLTVVALGTSSPELAVGIKSALSGNADIALGNVVGSNIFNILVIIALSAVITPLVVAQRLVGAGLSTGNPSATGTSHVTDTLLDWRATWSTTLKATPINTAYCKGMNSVARKVRTMTTVETRLVRQMVCAASRRSP